MRVFEQNRNVDFQLICFPFSRTAGTDKSPQHFLTVVGKSRYCRYLNVNHISDKVQIIIFAPPPWNTFSGDFSGPVKLI